MEAHDCNQQAEISEITTILKGLVKEFYGNGQKGLAREFPELRTSVENLTATIAAQTKVISDLVQFQSSFNAVEKYKEKQGISNRARVAIIITAIIGFCSMACTMIVKFV